MKALIFGVIGILLVAVTVLATLLISKKSLLPEHPPEPRVGTPKPPKAVINPDGTVTVQPVVASPPPTKISKLDEIGPGQTVTKQKIQEAKIVTTEPKRVDTGRLQATYQVGKTYINTVKASLASKGSYKDWGIETTMTFNYAGEFQISRFIGANDGNQMMVDVQVDRARNLSVFTKIDGVSIKLGGVFQNVLEIGGVWAGLPPGSIEVGKQELNQLLNQEVILNYCSGIASDKQAKIFAHVESIQGKKAHIIFENGKGVISITPIGCSLSEDEQLFLEGLSLCSDITTMEKLDCKPGDTWQVAGKDFMSFIEPSMKSKVDGSVTVVRKEDLKIGESPEARLTIGGGILQFNDRYRTEDNQIQSHGSWAPKGELIFNFGDKIVTEAQMEGSLEIVEQSVDHILFEMKNVTRPEFHIQYSAWIVDGDKLKETPKLTRSLKEGTLDALHKRMQN